MRLFSCLMMGLSMIVATSASAASTPPDFDPARWQSLVQQILEKGTPMQYSDGILMTLSNIVPADTTKSHHADYISTMGIRSNGQYVPYQVSTVSENWQLTPEGNWDIDQWLYLLAMDGQLMTINHIHIVETQSGLVLKDEFLPTGGPSSPEALERWGKKLNEWYTVALPTEVQFILR